MNYGLYLSASGVLTSLYRQDVFANNLANVETVGFKPDTATVRQRDPESIEDNFGFELRKRLLDRLGGGVLAGPQRISFGVGAMQRTGQPLDVALDDANAFLAVQANDSQGNPAVRLTRDGRFSLDAQGQLVTSNGGFRVLDVDDRPISVDPTLPVRLTPAGAVMQDGNEVARIQVAAVGDKDRLRKLGKNLLAMPDDADLRRPVLNPVLKTGFVESSGVDAIDTLMDVTGAGRDAQSNAKLIGYYDTLLERTVNTLGRVSA